MGRLRAISGDFASRILAPVVGSIALKNHTDWLAEKPPDAKHDWLRKLKSSDGMRVSGVHWNHSGDFSAFVYGIIVNATLVFLSLGAFVLLRRAYPAIFSNNARNGLVKRALPDGLWGWVSAARSITPEERAEWMGLDIAMAIEFHALCTRLMFMIGIPMLMIMAPMNYYLGDNSGVDKLSRIGMANLSYHHPWIYYLIAFVVWAEVLLCEVVLRSAHDRFLVLRTAWLHRQPEPRASTVLVEGIPRQHRTDEHLKGFFEAVFGTGSVRAATVMKRTGDLPSLVTKCAAAKHAQHKAELEWERAGGNPGDRPLTQKVCCGKQDDAIDFYHQHAKELSNRITSKREEILSKAASCPGGVNMDWGFVTFKSRQLAEIALVVRYTWSTEEWRTSLPPEPGSVDWKSLTMARPCRVCAMTTGYLITAGLFLGFIPICLHITNLAITIDMGPLQPVWAAFAPTLGLLLFVSLLPTVLLWIFQNFFTLYSDTWAQNHLQEWYFLFMIFFVVLVTAIGNDLSVFLKRVAEHPVSIFHLLADKLPFATHFYINYLVLQWPGHLIHCSRLANLARFVGARQLFKEEEARLLAEPEDQGYHGLGSRSARWTINAVVGIVFSTLSPLVPLIAGIDFAICHVMFGYVLVYAETKKNDLGGAFWVKQMQHMRMGLFIYCVLMVGVLLARAADHIPGMLAAPTLLFVLWSYMMFDSKICIVGLPIAELAALHKVPPVGDTGEVYVQPELQDTH